MSYLLEALGRGLLGQLLDAFENQLPGNRDDDATALTARRRESPASLDLALRLGLAQLRELRLCDARKTLEAALLLAETPLQPALCLASVHDELGQLDRVLHYLNKAAACDARDPAIAFAIGACHERGGDRPAAGAAYRRAADLCPQLRNAHERLAAIALRERDFAAATLRYEILSELDPGDMNVRLTRAALYLHTGRAAEAIEQFQQALLIEPECFDGPLNIGGEGDEAETEGAIAAVQALVDKYPGVADFHVQLGDLLARTGDDAAAIAAYAAALAIQPTYLEATIKLGTQHLRRERLVDAAQAFNRAVELNDRLITAFVGLGVAQHAAGHPHEARGSLDLVASLEPNSTLLFAETTRLQLKSHQSAQRGPIARTRGGGARTADTGLLEEALRRHRQALLLRPNQADLHYRHGLMLRHVGRAAEAMRAFRSAIAINPGYVQALIKLAIGLHEAGESGEARTLFERALTLDERAIDVHYELGLRYAQRSQFDLAVERFEQSMANAERLAVRQNLTLALQAIGMVDRENAGWRAGCELMAEADVPRRTPGGGP